MISRIIEWCEQNRFLVFTGVVLLTVAGVWSLRHIPLDALPDISDVQVVIHTEWPGEPPNVIEDQVTYPIVTTLLAAPHVKSVRAQTMFGDSYVFVVFEDGTDLYWARSRVTEYLQQIGGRLPADVHPAIGPDATGAGWVYEYAVIDRPHTKSLADLRALQDWYLRYQLETVPGVAEVATIGGYVRQYQVKLDPNKLFSYGIPVSTVIERVRDSTNEVGGNVLEMNGGEYMVRGLGYLRSGVLLPSAYSSLMGIIEPALSLSSTFCSSVRFPVATSTRYIRASQGVPEDTNSACPSSVHFCNDSCCSTPGIASTFCVSRSNTTASPEAFRPAIRCPSLATTYPIKSGGPNGCGFPPFRSISYIRSGWPSLAPISSRCLPSGNHANWRKLTMSPSDNRRLSPVPIGCSTTCGGRDRSGAAAVVPSGENFGVAPAPSATGAEPSSFR
jgi:hypothetical protein